MSFRNLFCILIIQLVTSVPTILEDDAKIHNLLTILSPGQNSDELLKTAKLNQEFTKQNDEYGFISTTATLTCIHDPNSEKNPQEFSTKAQNINKAEFDDFSNQNETNEEIIQRGDNWYKNVRYDHSVTFYYSEDQAVLQTIEPAFKNTLLRTLEDEAAFLNLEQYDYVFDEKNQKGYYFNLNYAKSEDPNTKNVIGQLVRFMIITNSLIFLKKEKGLGINNFSAKNIVFGSNINHFQLNFPVLTHLQMLTPYDDVFTEQTMINLLADFFLFRLNASLDTLKDAKFQNDLPIGEIYFHLINEMKNGTLKNLSEVRDKLKNEVFVKINPLTIFHDEDNEIDVAYDNKFIKGSEDLRYKASFENFLKSVFMKVKSDANDFFNHLNIPDEGDFTVEDLNAKAFNHTMANNKIAQSVIYNKILLELRGSLQHHKEKVLL